MLKNFLTIGTLIVFSSCHVDSQNTVSTPAESRIDGLRLECSTTQNDILYLDLTDSRVSPIHIESSGDPAYLPSVSLQAITEGVYLFVYEFLPEDDIESVTRIGQLSEDSNQENYQLVISEYFEPSPASVNNAASPKVFTCVETDDVL